jgi:hypothetical protein
MNHNTIKVPCKFNKTINEGTTLISLRKYDREQDPDRKMNESVAHVQSMSSELIRGSPKENMNVVEHVQEIVECKANHVEFVGSVTSPWDGNQVILNQEWTSGQKPPLTNHLSVNFVPQRLEWPFFSIALSTHFNPYKSEALYFYKNALNERKKIWN